jgi:hypothetical protein
MWTTSNIRATPPRARDAQLPVLLFHLSTAPHQHADAGAVDGGENRNVDHQAAATLVDQVQDRPLDQEQSVAETQASRDIDDVDVPDFARSGVSNHGADDGYRITFSVEFLSSMTITSMG